MSEQGEALRRRHRRLMFLGAVPALLYLIAVVAHAIFPEGKLNEALSTRMFFAHFYAFPILFGGLILLLSSLILLVILLKHGAKGPVKSPFFLPWLLVLLASLVFVLEGHDAVKVEAARPAGPSFKIVSWNALNQLDQTAQGRSSSVLMQMWRFFRRWGAMNGAKLPSKGWGIFWLQPASTRRATRSSPPRPRAAPSPR